MDRTDWDSINKYHFYGYGTVLFCGLTTSLFPLFVVKTQMQVAAAQSLSINEGSNFLGTIRHIVRTKGLGGLWRGLGIVLVGEIPIQATYVTVLELSRAGFSSFAAGWSERQQATFTSAASGATACLSAQICIVPTDIISQRQVVAAGAKQSALATSKAILAAEGFWGLYRGFAVSCAQSAPQHTVWWGVYGYVRHRLSPSMPRSAEIVAGVTAGLVTATVTQPMDLVRTRLQTAETPHCRSGVLGLQAAREMARDIVRTQGARALWRGLAPRALHQACWGTALVNLYEQLRRLSMK